MDESIPVIDMQQISDQVECNRLREACEKRGSFWIINHPIPVTLMADMKMVSRSLLDLPLDIKKRNADVIDGSGYVAPTEANPLYEAIGLFNIGSSQAWEDFCSQLEASPHQRQIIEAYCQGIHDLVLTIRQHMAESMGVKGADFKDRPVLCRLNKYNFTPETIGSSGLQLHTDIVFLTILQLDETNGGLEVMENSGTFAEISPKPGALLVNIGDVAHVWSNGRFCNVKHRVQCKAATIRVSIATFMLPPRELYIEAPTELVDPDHPRLYPPFNYEDYKKLRGATNLRAGEALELLRMA